MDTFEMDVCFAKLFLEISFLIAFYYTTNRNNKAIALNNFVYYLKVVLTVLLKLAQNFINNYTS